jgi:hypothetical protein
MDVKRVTEEGLNVTGQLEVKTVDKESDTD